MEQPSSVRSFTDACNNQSSRKSGRKYCARAGFIFDMASLEIVAFARRDALIYQLHKLERVSFFENSEIVRSLVVVPLMSKEATECKVLQL